MSAPDIPRDRASGAVEVRDLCKSYGSTPVLVDANVEVVPGEMFTLLGPSGSGKSTLLHCIAGFTQQTSGSVFVDGTCLDGVPVHERGLGMVFQNYSLFPHMTVAENIAFPLEIRNMGRPEIAERTERVLDLVSMTGTEGRRPAQLSGGQQQRIAIARALVFDPPVLLMDEPMSALDRKLRRGLQVELRELQRALGITMIFVTHDQEEAMTMSDRIAVLNNGRIDQMASPQDIYERPTGLFSAEFLGDSTTFPGRVVSVDNEVAVVEVAGGALVRGRAVSVAAGDETVCNIRAERVHVLAADDPRVGDRTAIGLVEDTIFVGSELRHLIRTDFAERLLVTSPNTGRQSEIRSNDRVSIMWDAQDMSCFPLRDSDGDGSNEREAKQ